MKNIFLFLVIVGVLASCAPGKSDRTVRVDVYCTNCDIGIRNNWSMGTGKDHGYTIDYRGNIQGYKSIELQRYEAPISCFMITEWKNYAEDSATLVYIENNDTIGLEFPEPEGFCH